MSTKQKLLNKLLTAISILVIIMRSTNNAITASVKRYIEIVDDKDLCFIRIVGPNNWGIFNKDVIKLMLAGMLVSKGRVSLQVYKKLLTRPKALEILALPKNVESKLSNIL